MSSISATGKLPQIYSVGYGNRTTEQLFDLVKSNDCRYLIDVRSIPYSRYQQEYNRESLEKACIDFGLNYLYLGHQLGGKPAEHDQDKLGRPDYLKMSINPIFEEGLQRLIKALELGHSVMLMCAELRPETCHRTKLIGVALFNSGVELVHIDENAKLSSQSEVLRRLDNRQNDLFC